jgi:DNA-binding YbaB/EbfC family protein
MQQKMSEMQERMAELEVEGSSGAGMVTVVLSGKSDMRRIKIDPSLLKPDEVEVLEDLVVAATNDARARLETRMQEEMSQVTGGIELPPGMKLPF